MRECHRSTPVVLGAPRTASDAFEASPGTNLFLPRVWRMTRRWLVALVPLLICGPAWAGYTFSGGGTLDGYANGDSGTGNLWLRESGGLIEHSEDGSSFSSDWTGGTIAATASTTINVYISTGNGSNLMVGLSGFPASDLLGTVKVFNLLAANTNTCTVDDSSRLTANSYTVEMDNPPYGITFTGLNYYESQGLFKGGVTLKGPSAGSTFAVNSTAANEPFTAIGGGGNDTFTVNADGLAAPAAVDGGDPTPPASPGDILTINYTNAVLSSSVLLTGSGYQGDFTESGSAQLLFSHIERLINFPGVPSEIPVLGPLGIALLASLLAFVTLLALTRGR
jgi:hypothetical protein